jgi:putative redox protein
MKANVVWKGEVQFEAESGSGHKVTMDGPPDLGGQNHGSRPMEMILMGLGGCASFDVVSMLQKGRQKIVSCIAECSAERADTVPAVFTKIHLNFVISGQQLKESLVKRAVTLSAEKYCSASILMERAGVKLTHSYVIQEIKND